VLVLLEAAVLERLLLLQVLLLHTLAAEAEAVLLLDLLGLVDLVVQAVAATDQLLTQLQPMERLVLAEAEAEAEIMVH
jgi:hypothetical protein